MPNTNELTLNSPLDMKNATLPRFDFGYWIIVFFTVVMAIFIVAQVFGLVASDETTLIGNSLKTVVGIVGVIMSFSVTRSLDGNLRRTWKILTLAYFFNTGGDTIWYYYASILGEKPFPSWADVSFLLSYPVMLWALLSYPTKSRFLEKKKIAADISIVMVGGITLVWYFIVNPTLSAVTDEDWLSPALNLSYTVGDMVLILGIFVAFFRGVEDNLKRALQIIVGGVVCMLVADLGFAYLTLQGTYFGGHWIENFFIFNSLSHIYAAYYQHRKSNRETEAADEPADLKKIGVLNWMPYVAVLLGLGLLGWEARNFWAEPLGKIVYASILLTGLVVLRQIIAVRENIKLLEEKNLRQREVRFGALVQNSSDMISILSPDGAILYESPSVKNALGYEIDELVGTESSQILHPEDAAERSQILKQLAADHLCVVRKELRIRHKDGSWRFFETVSRFVDDPENNLHGILVNSRDVTQRRQDEERLRVYTNKLERSNRELQDFAYVASHDLQEPLRKVQAFGDRLDRKCAAELGVEGRDYVNRMRNAANRMQNLINDLLTFSRVTTKIQPFKPTDLRKVCEDVVSDLEVRIEQTGGRVEIGALPTIDADPLQMRQLLQNLIGNALKFHRPDVGPVVRIYAQAVESTGASFCLNGEEIRVGDADPAADGVCRLVVEDNGIGFDEKYLDRIFTVFQRLHGRSEYEGSGIGLAVCRKIVERHGGTITANGRPGEGAKFYINLPIAQEEIAIHETRP
ncbi:MAG: PAS domain S-box protein [Acidobacteria bacterium]|nr:PAS domain S-box protein [Acidobacteriota bacterium]